MSAQANGHTHHADASASSPSTAMHPNTAAALEASRDLEEQLATSPTTANGAPTSSAAAAERAMSHIEAWKPAMNRRQSWNQQERKHSLQMSSIADIKEGPGFSERQQ